MSLDRDGWLHILNQETIRGLNERVRCLELDLRDEARERIIHGLSLAARLDRLETGSKTPEAAKSFDLNQMMGTMWFRAAVLLALLGLNIGLESASKILSMLR